MLEPNKEPTRKDTQSVHCAADICILFLLPALAILGIHSPPVGIRVSESLCAWQSLGGFALAQRIRTAVWCFAVHALDTAYRHNKLTITITPPFYSLWACLSGACEKYIHNRAQRRRRTRTPQNMSVSSPQYFLRCTFAQHAQYIQHNTVYATQQNRFWVRKSLGVRVILLSEKKTLLRRSKLLPTWFNTL